MTNHGIRHVKSRSEQILLYIPIATRMISPIPDKYASSFSDPVMPISHGLKSTVLPL